MRPLTNSEAGVAALGKDQGLVDQFIDLMLNYRQSGHPGGSRSKVHALVALTLGRRMRWDIRHPEKRFGDRFVLVAGHCCPLVYATLAVLNEALRAASYEQTGDARYLVLDAKQFARLHVGGPAAAAPQRRAPGHAEMEGKTLFLKSTPARPATARRAAAGQALALKRAGADGVKVFAIEGEGGLTPPARTTRRRTRPGAWGWTTCST